MPGYVIESTQTIQCIRSSHCTPEYMYMLRGPTANGCTSMHVCACGCLVGYNICLCDS